MAANSVSQLSKQECGVQQRDGGKEATKVINVVNVKEKDMLAGILCKQHSRYDLTPNNN